MHICFNIQLSRDAGGVNDPTEILQEILQNLKSSTLKLLASELVKGERDHSIQTIWGTLKSTVSIFVDVRNLN